MDPIKDQKASEDLAARAIELSGLVQIQPGAVVSREILRKKTGTVTVFAFDKGQGLSEHTAPFDALVLVLEGRVEVTIAGTPHPVKAGEMIIMPAGKPHALQAVDPFKMALIMIRS
jgi:quercetin dioxygenase-like cupin family protein